MSHMPRKKQTTCFNKQKTFAKIHFAKNDALLKKHSHEGVMDTFFPPRGLFFQPLLFFSTPIPSMLTLLRLKPSLWTPSVVKTMLYDPVCYESNPFWPRLLRKPSALTPPVVKTIFVDPTPFFIPFISTPGTFHFDPVAFDTFPWTPFVVKIILFDPVGCENNLCWHHFIFPPPYLSFDPPLES